MADTVASLPYERTGHPLPSTIRQDKRLELSVPTNPIRRYTDDMRLKYVTTPAFSAEHMKTLFGSTDTQTLIIKAENSYKNGLYRNTGFLLDEKTYPSRNVRVRSVPGDHNVHVTWPRNVAFYMALYLLYGAEGLSSKAKL